MDLGIQASEVDDVARGSGDS